MTQGLARFSTKVYKMLVKSGWYPGRCNDQQVAEWLERLAQHGPFDVSPAAKDVLAEFGGLKVDQLGPGEECLREPFVFNPLVAAYTASMWPEISQIVGERVFPVGEVSDGYMYIAVGESGKVFLVMDIILLAGKDIDDALEHMIRGLQKTRIY